MLSKNYFLESLSDNVASLPLRAEATIIAEAEGKAVVPASHLELNAYARLNLCKREALPEPRAGLSRYWGGEDADRLFTSYDQVVWKVEWNNQQLHVVHLEWETGCGGGSRDWVVADTPQIAEDFILDVDRKTHAPGESILVFAEGHWDRDYGLYAATQSASFDDLVLADDLKQTIRRDFARFLESEEQYQQLGIAWRRGALMIGPPGNGKTHCVRALIKELGIPSLYVQSLSHHYYTPHQMWQQVFQRARGLTPCVLVLEDLDTLVDDENRSFFLNQLDGFDQNHGLIVLATTNYPDRIDAAIIDRPSRFDRKYHFRLPAEPEREAFLATWQARLAEQTDWSEDQVAHVASATPGYSFAYLKELMISSVMKWMEDSSVPFAEVLLTQAATLGKQMKTEAKTASNGEPDGRRRKLLRW